MAARAKTVYIAGAASGLVAVQPCLFLPLSVAIITLVIGAVIILASNRCSQNLVRILKVTFNARPKH